MEVSQIYERWLEKARDDKDLVKELESLRGNDNEIYERFYDDLKFGTAGLRGVIGTGTYRMNIYTVRRATQGLANYLNKKYPKASVAISHDSRIKARLFAMQAAAVLAANNIKVYISKELQPTPVLSYAVRELACQSGIMITASHNPAKYNGYKCYGSDGCQMTDNDAESVYNEIQSVDYFDNVKIIDFDTAVEQGKIEYINDELYERYLDDVQKQTVLKDICKDAGLSVVYTPLNGAGNKLIRKIMNRIGVDNVTVVKEQELPDGNFSTCPYPNPEFKEALELGLKLCDEIKPDLLIASDPDSDRVGIAVKDNSSYRLLSGNETGVMLTQYILSNRKRLGTLPQNPILIKTIVTSILTNRLAEEYGCELKDVLTGFKYIGEQILSLEQKGELNRYIFGFEESYGYLAGTYVRDKDAVVASMLICEMAAYYKKQGLTLAQVIDNIYEKYGYYMNKTYNYSFEGATGMEHMAEIMNNLRKSELKEIAGYKLTRFADFKAHISYNMITGEKTTIALPTSDVLLFALDGGNQAIVRPSGTEPKIKLYVTSVGKDEAEADVVGKKLKNSMMSLMDIEQ